VRGDIFIETLTQFCQLRQERPIPVENMEILLPIISLLTELGISDAGVTTNMPRLATLCRGCPFFLTHF
jgi:hypothetical protein